MAGISSYSAYIPFYRLSRAEIARAWGTAPQPGEKAVASYDEDSLTMGVAAAIDCIKGIDIGTIGGVYFATTTAPYKEKQCAATVANILGLPQDAVTMDFSGSLRSGTNALKAAIDAVNSGTVSSILVCAADTRLSHPQGAYEMSVGDGAAAILVGAKDVMAEIDQFYTRYKEIQDTWRSDKDQFIRTAEDRFAIEEGYIASMKEAVSGLLSKSKLTPKDFAKASFYSPTARQLGAIAQRLGFDTKLQVPDILHPYVGDTGSAMSLMGLIAVLEEANANEKILSASYGNGTDLFVLTTTEMISEAKYKNGVRKNLASKSLMPDYSKYLRWRELVSVQPPARPPLEERQPSPAAQWRDAEWEGRLTGTQCTNCGTPQYPKQRVCINCGARDQYEPYTFFNKPARLFSFCHDYVMQTIEPPVTVTVVDFEGGGRLMCDMTDRDPNAIKVGMPVDMTFRRLYFVGGIYNYWWKCRPIRS